MRTEEKIIVRSKWESMSERGVGVIKDRVSALSSDAADGGTAMAGRGLKNQTMTGR